MFYLRLLCLTAAPPQPQLFVHYHCHCHCHCHCRLRQRPLAPPPSYSIHASTNTDNLYLHFHLPPSSTPPKPQLNLDACQDYSCFKGPQTRSAVHPSFAICSRFHLISPNFYSNLFAPPPLSSLLTAPRPPTSRPLKRPIKRSLLLLA